MNYTTKGVLFMFVTLFVIILFWIMWPSIYDTFFLSYSCREDKEMKELSFTGVVKQKFTDSNNHNLHAITVLTNNKIWNFHILFDEDSVIWNKTQVKDSIIKNANTTTFFIRNDKKSDTINVHFSCKN